MQDLNWEDIQVKTSEAIGKAMRLGEESFIEFLQSKQHICDKSKNSSLIYFTSPQGILKAMKNEHSIFCYPTSFEVECCMWCGYRAKDQQ